MRFDKNGNLWYCCLIAWIKRGFRNRQAGAPVAKGGERKFYLIGSDPQPGEWKLGVSGS
jgi:hypothetical protein